VEIGDVVIIAGGVGIADHVRIGAGSMIGAGSGVATNVAAGTKVLGYPAQPYARATETIAFLLRHKRVTKALTSAADRLDALEKALRQPK